MKRMLLLAWFAAMPLTQAQNPPGYPVRCSDVEFDEAGWTCQEHFGLAFENWPSITGYFPYVDLDSKGNLYRSLYRDPTVVRGYCNGIPLNETRLERYLPGYGFDRPELQQIVLRIPDRCVGNQFAWSRMTNVKMLTDDRLAVVVYSPAWMLGPNGQYAYLSAPQVLRIDRVAGSADPRLAAQESAAGENERPVWMDLPRAGANQ